MAASRFVIICSALSGILSCGMSSSVQARMEYNRVFWAEYQQELGKYAETTRCSVCHFGNDKKNRNVYGQAFGKSLGSAPVKDADTIRTAMQNVARQASLIPGKTFGDLIRGGVLPGSKS